MYYHNSCYSRIVFFSEAKCKALFVAIFSSEFPSDSVLARYQLLFAVPDSVHPRPFLEPNIIPSFKLTVATGCTSSPMEIRRSNRCSFCFICSIRNNFPWTRFLSSAHKSDRHSCLPSHPQTYLSSHIHFLITAWIGEAVVGKLHELHSVVSLREMGCLEFF